MYTPNQLGPYPQHRFAVQNTIIAANIIQAAANASTIATLYSLLNTATAEDDLATQTLISQGTQSISANSHICLGVATPIGTESKLPYLATISGQASTFNQGVRAFPYLARTNLTTLTAGYTASVNPSQNFQLLPLESASPGVYSVNTSTVVYPTDDATFLIAGWIYQNSVGSTQNFIPNQSLSLHRYLKNIDTIDPVR